MEEKKPYQLTQSEEAVQRKHTEMKNRLCKNQELSIQTGKQDYTTLVFEFRINNEGCDNDRRNGSAYCQKCSDKHKHAKEI